MDAGVKLPWWGLLIILAAGFLGGAGAAYLAAEQQRAELRAEIDAHTLARKIDSTRSAERDAQFVEEINRLAAEFEQQQQQSSIDSTAAAATRQRELVARRDRDTALARLDLTTEQLANVSREIARADQAADSARVASDQEVRSVRVLLATQMMRSAALQRRGDSLRAETSRLHTSVGILEVQLRDRITQAPPRGKLLGLLPRLYCGPGPAVTIRGEATVVLACVTPL